MKMELNFLSDIVGIAFHEYKYTVLSLGNALPSKDGIKISHDSYPLLAVTNSSVICCSGSPYFHLDNPQFVLAQHLGSGVEPKNETIHPVHQPNYNLALSVNHPEWVLNYAKYVLPDLPVSDHKIIIPYLQKHRPLIERFGMDLSHILGPK